MPIMLAKGIAATLDEFLSKSYDYIICGGGTAGLVLANRLSEDSNIQVGVLEAGQYKKDDMLVDTPALLATMFGNKDYDWSFKSTPQKTGGGKPMHIARGKMLGGSSGINFMIYVRGSAQDYDDWAELAGDSSWSWDNMKKYMKKHQTLDNPDELDHELQRLVPENHGTAGPLHTGFDPIALPADDAAMKAYNNITGLGPPTDSWGGDHIGFARNLGLVVRSGANKGKRSYAARAYFEPVAHRDNLTVLCEAFVTKIVLDENRATGVQFEVDGAPYEIKTSREVLLCQGVFQSPQLLELSGIGDPNILRAAGVDPKVNLPGVGKHLQEHIGAIEVYAIKSGVLAFNSIFDPQIMEAAQKELQENMSGQLTSTCSTQGYVPYKRLVSPEELRETVASIRDTQKESSSNFEKAQLEQIIRHLNSDTSANLHFITVSCGFDMIEGPWDQNPHTQPAIDPGYLNHPADISLLRAARKLTEKAARTAPLSDYLAQRIYPAPEIDLEDDATADADIKKCSMGTWHPLGSCAIGEVVNTRLRVHGVEGLRVVDASVFPNNVSGNIVSSVYAVAEKAADMIKEDQKASGSVFPP